MWELRVMVSEKGIHMEWQPRIGSQTPSKKKRVSTHGWRWESEVAQLFLTLCDPMDVHQASPSMGFSRQEYWIGLPFPSPGDFGTQGLNPGLLHCRQMLLPSGPRGKLSGGGGSEDQSLVTQRIIKQVNV